MQTTQFVSLLTILATLAAGSLNAQAPKQPTTPSPRSDWVRVQQTQEKRNINVRLTGGKKVSGAFLGADAEGVELLVDGKQTMKIPKQEIRRISVKSKTRGALWLGVTGAIVGVPVGIAASIGANARHGSVPTMLIAGIAACGLAGAAIGAAIGNSTVLYEAPGPSSAPPK